MHLGIYDILVLVLIGGAAFFGWQKGLATQVASIFSIVVSCFVAMNFREQLSGVISAAPPFDTIAAMLVLYLGTSFVIWLLFRQVRTSIERLKLREFDHQMGFVVWRRQGTGAGRHRDHVCLLVARTNQATDPRVPVGATGLPSSWSPRTR